MDRYKCPAFSGNGLCSRTMVIVAMGKDDKFKIIDIDVFFYLCYQSIRVDTCVYEHLTIYKIRVRIIVTSMEFSYVHVPYPLFSILWSLEAENLYSVFPGSTCYIFLFYSFEL